MDADKIKVAVSDVISDFYNEVMKKRFDHIEWKLSNLNLTTQALVK